MNVAEFAAAMTALNAEFEEAVERARHACHEKSRAVLCEFLGQNPDDVTAKSSIPRDGFLAERARGTG